MKRTEKLVTPRWLTSVRAAVLGAAAIFTKLQKKPNKGTEQLRCSQRSSLTVAFCWVARLFVLKLSCSTECRSKCVLLDKISSLRRIRPFHLGTGARKHCFKWRSVWNTAETARKLGNVTGLHSLVEIQPFSFPSLAFHNCYPKWVCPSGLFSLTRKWAGCWVRKKAPNDVCCSF